MTTYRPALERFIEKIEGGTGGCWLWTAGLDRHGYGRFGVLSVSILAHRWSYEHFVGPIPDGLQLDHLCRVRRCVNPLHLEPVSSRENSVRGVVARKTHCANGHEFTPENTYIVPKYGHRKCRECVNRWARERRARKTPSSLPPSGAVPMHASNERTGG